MAKGEIIELPYEAVHLSLGRNSGSTDVAAPVFLAFAQALAPLPR